MDRLIDYDPLTGTRDYYVSLGDRWEDPFEVRTEFDSNVVDAILENNKARFNDTPAKSEHTKSEFWHVADIPICVQMDWLVNHGVDIYDPNATPKIMKLLNDPDYRYLKVRNIIL